MPRGTLKMPTRTVLPAERGREMVPHVRFVDVLGQFGMAVTEAESKNQGWQKLRVVACNVQRHTAASPALICGTVTRKCRRRPSRDRLFANHAQQNHESFTRPQYVKCR